MMHSSTVAVLAAAVAGASFAVSSAAAATVDCTPNKLIDDFSVVRPWYAPTGEFKRLNALGGSWGQYGGNFSIDTKEQELTINAQDGSTLYPADASYNPGTVETYNWFFTQFNNQTENFDLACFNATNYTGVTMTVYADEGDDFNITFTQRLEGDCDTRTYDSQYNLFSKYYTTPGKEQTIFLPFTDFATDLSGAAYNFQWMKDLTFVNLGPVNANFTLKNVILNGNCEDNGSNTTTTSTPSSNNAASRNKNAFFFPILTIASALIAIIVVA